MLDSRHGTNAFWLNAAGRGDVSEDDIRVLVLCEVVGVALVAVMLREPGMRGYGGAMLSGDLCLTRAILWPRLTNILGA